MRPLPYAIRKRAQIDIKQIWLYTAEKWSVTQADRYYREIINEIENICRNVDMGKPVGKAQKGYRASKVKSHLILYRVIKNTVEIVRVVHKQMDINSKLVG